MAQVDSRPRGRRWRVTRIAAGGIIALSLLVLAAGLTLRGRAGGGGLGSGTTLTVTSSQDAGPGSLRDAVLAADRSPGRVRIVVAVKRIEIGSALPPLANAAGIEIEAGQDAGTIDADRQEAGAALQINAPSSVLRGLHLVNAHGTAVVVNAAHARLESLIVERSKIGILLGPAAEGCAIRGSTFARDDIAVTAAAQVGDLEVESSLFRANVRAGIWIVGAVGAVGRTRAQILDSVFDANASGIVAGNRSLSVQKSRFTDNRESAVLILGGSVAIQDSEIRGSGTGAVSVVGGEHVLITGNIFTDNAAAAISLRDTGASVEHNTLRHNALGIVAMTSRDVTTIIRDNLVTQTTADALTLIGGAPEVEGNRIVDNQGAGVRTLDLVLPGAQSKAQPRLAANLIQGNKIDLAAPGIYRVAGNR